MHTAQKKWADIVKDKPVYMSSLGEQLGDWWASIISQFFGGVEEPNSISPSKLRNEIGFKSRFGYDEEVELLYEEMRLRLEKEIEDTEFRLKRGSDLGRFDQFWDGDFADSLFNCRYSRSKWLYLNKRHTTAPLEIYLHALKGNENIIHITFDGFHSDSDVNWLQAMIYDLPWVTSISHDSPHLIPAIHRDPLFIKSTNNDLITFAKEIRLKLDPFSTYIFTDAEIHDILYRSYGLRENARVLISFVAPISDKSLTLRLKHSGGEDKPLEITLGSTIIQLNRLNPSSKSELTIDDITLYPIQVPGPSASESDYLSFAPGIRNDIVIQFRGTLERHWQGHILYDIELLDEAGLEDPRNQIVTFD